MNRMANIGGTAQYITLGIDEEVFAVDVAQVHEILDMRHIARIPNAPAYLLGMIDVRQRTVPVVDLRIKLGLPPTVPGPATRIIVLDVAAGEKTVVMGMMADRVYEVAPLAEHGIEAPPDIGIRWRSQFIKGVGRRNDKFVIILDVGQLFSGEETLLISPASATSEE